MVAVPIEGMVGYLSTIFGRERFQRILARAGIDLTHRTSNFLFTSEVKFFLTYAAEIFESDFQELLAQIKSDSDTVTFLNEDESIELRDYFRDVRVLDDCSNEQLNRLFTLLSPFGPISHLFSNGVFDFLVDAAFGRIPFELLKRRVSIYDKMNDDQLAYEKWMMLLAKGLINYDPSVGTVFRNGYGGFCKIHDIIAQEGACKFFLKQIGESQRFHNVVAYRGTVPHDPNTILEDFRKEFGSKGPQATYQKTQELVSNPELGFVKTKDEQIIGIGMSLGACQLMRDAVLLKHKFARIVPISGPGPDKESMQLYANSINKHEGNGPIIEHWWEGDDVSHYFGGAHLGFECKPEKAQIAINILEPLE